MSFFQVAVIDSLPLNNRLNPYPQQESHESYFLVNEPFVFGESMALSRPTKGSLPAPVVWVVAEGQSRFFDLLKLVLG